MAEENVLQKGDILLEAKNVHVNFTSANKKSVVHAVDGVNLTIRKGEVLGVVGESGCGKSTLGRALLRLVPLSEGSVVIGGRDISKLRGKELKEMRKKIQVIFQDPSACLNPRRTILQILEEPYLIHGIKDKAYIDEDIHRLIGLVGLADYHLTRYPHELSGGQKQRVGIARALTLKPELIVCDECVSALDVSVQAQVLNLLVSLKEKLGLTYLFISHNLNVVYQISDRVAVMYLGRLMEIAPYGELYDSPMHPYTQALLSAIPEIDPAEQKERIILGGEVPSPLNPPKGCHFHTRCTRACEICHEKVPSWIEAEPGHFVACHLYDKT